MGVDTDHIPADALAQAQAWRRRFIPRERESDPLSHPWDHAVEVWHVLRPALWPMLISLLLSVIILAVGQTRDLFAAMRVMPDEADFDVGVSGRFWAAWAACGFYAFSAWMFSRALLAVRFPYTPAPLDPPDYQVTVRVWAARFIGLGVPVVCAITYWSLGLPQEGMAYVGLTAGLFLLFWFVKPFMRDWIHRRETRARDTDTASASAPASPAPVAEAESGPVAASAEQASLEAMVRHVQTGLTKAGQSAALEAGRSLERAHRALQEHELFDQAMPTRLPRPLKLMLLTILLINAGVAVVFSVSQVTAPQWVGAAAIVFLAAAGWLSFGVFVLTYLSRNWRLPSAIVIWLGLLAIASLVNDNHEIAKTTPERPQMGPRAMDIGSYAQTWLEARAGVLPRYGEAETYPVLLIAAEGGGARAAYWTGTSLAALVEPDPGLALDPSGRAAATRQAADHIFLISGVSGGALGTAAFASGLRDAPERLGVTLTQFLAQDHLSPVTAGLLFPDMLTDIFPFPLLFADRARWLETSWIHGWRKATGAPDASTFSADFRGLWVGQEGQSLLAQRGAPPLTVFNTTSVRSGAMWRVSPVRFSPERTCKAQDFVSILEEAGVGLPLAAAAHLSARFTGVSPAGRIDLPAGFCGEGQSDRFVDGAYYENSGADTAALAIRPLREAIERFCAGDNDSGVRCDPAQLPIIPVVLIAEPGAAGPPPDLFHELSSPAAAVLNTRSARGRDAIARFALAGDEGEFVAIEMSNAWRLEEESAGCNIGFDPADLDEGGRSGVSQIKREVPLGWTLSNQATEHMCRELKRNSALAALRFRLANSGRYLE
jgi:hypothetical protein